MTHDFDPDIPDGECPYSIGDMVHVTRASANNDVGGTLLLGEREFDVTIVKAFWDYEAGWRFWGKVVGEDDIETVRKLGETGARGDRPYGEHLRGVYGMDKVDPDFWIYDPARVYFTEYDVAPQPALKL